MTAGARKFRVELEWKDLVAGSDVTYSVHHDFPDASRASAFAVAFKPAGNPLPTRTNLHEVARTDQAVVRLFEVTGA